MHCFKKAFKNNKIYVQAAELADSVPTKAYQETINKAKALPKLQMKIALIDNYDSFTKSTII